MGGSDTGNATGLHPAGDGPNFDAKSYAYFGLRREALNANQPAIFVAPDTDPAGSLWNYDKDSVYFDDLLKLVTPLSHALAFLVVRSLEHVGVEQLVPAVGY
jgi:hypothetical protein